MNIVEIIQSNPLVWILSVITISGIAYLFRLSLTQRGLFKETGKAIATAFSPELNALIHSNECASRILTSEAFRRHESSIRNNITGLPIFKQFRLNSAWKELAYHKDDKKKQIPFYEQYFSGSALDQRKILNRLAINRIQKIISIVS